MAKLRTGHEPEDLLENSTLLECAVLIADGKEVDWASIERSHPHHPEAIEGLKSMERVIRAQRETRPAAPPAHTIGTWGHLQLVEVIASGVFGDVYRAFDPNLQIDVALKLFRAARSEPDRAPIERCLREARKLAQVHHRNVVVVYGADLRDGRAGIWMELVRGKTLERHLAEDGSFAADEAARIGAEVCAALAAVHAAGMIHRDVKASNVMREQGGRIVLMDFGAASEVGGGIYGTPQAAAPELLRGEEGSAQADIYGVGALLYRLVTGRYPVEADSVVELLRRHEEGQRHSLREVRPAMPEWFASVVERALEAHPNRRYASAVAMERALKRPRSPWKPLVPLGIAAVVVAVGLVPPPPPPVNPDPSPGMQGATPSVSRTASSLPSATAVLMLERAGSAIPLRNGDRIAPGDGLFLEFEGDELLWTYVINRDMAGALYVLHPLEGLDRTNPLEPGVVHRLPGARQGVPESWRVSTAGGDEEFIVIASRARRQDLEDAVKRLTHAVPEADALARKDSNPPDGSAQDLLVRGTAWTAPSTVPPHRQRSRLPSVLEEILAGSSPAPGLWVARFKLKNPSH